MTGRPEVWAALSAATTLLRDGDIVTAQGIIDAAGITIPTGDFCDGCYDENGALYRLPQTIVMDPLNVVDSLPEDEGEYSSTTQLVDGGDISNNKLGMGFDSDDDLYDDELERQRDEKGKGIERDLIRVTTRLSDRGGQDITIAIGKDQSVGILARKVQVEAGVSVACYIIIHYILLLSGL